MRDVTSRPASNVVRGAFEQPLLEARNLRYVSGKTALIDGIDLALSGQKRTMILGANGSGKSLLLRLLHGLITPQSGQLFWQGAAFDRKARAEQAMVFQRPVMLRRSVLANLRFALTARGIGGAERQRRSEEALALARLEDAANRPARVLSGGEQQRLAIARAMVMQPRLLLLDEPTASLDPASTAMIETLIQTANERGMGIIMVSHDRGQAQRLAEEIVFMHAGKIAERGPAARVLTSPTSGPAQAWIAGELYL